MGKQHLFFAEGGGTGGWTALECQNGSELGGRAHKGLVKSRRALLGFYTALALKKGTCRISKKPLHTERFSASHCISLSFTQQSNSMDSWASAPPVAGNEMDCESDGLSLRCVTAQGRKEDGWKNQGICPSGYQARLNLLVCQ